MPTGMYRRFALALLLMTVLVAGAPLHAQDENGSQTPETEDTQEPRNEGGGVETHDPATETDEGTGEEGSEEGEGEDDTLAAMIRESFKDLEKVTGETEFSKADLKLLLQHHESLEELMADDEEFRAKLRTNLHTGFKHLIESDRYQEWATSHELDAERYARVTLRIRTTFMKQYFGRHLQSLITSQRALVEKYRDELPFHEYQAIIHELDGLEASYTRAQTELDKAPGPTDAEEALLAEHRETLSRLFELPVPDEDAEDAKEDEADESDTEEDEGD
jgi:hypothetical protein